MLTLPLFLFLLGSGQSEEAWVQAMKDVHARFQGKTGSVAQYGDSITHSKAFLGALYWGDYKTDLDIGRFRSRALRDCYEWKGPEHCNYSGWTIRDGLRALPNALENENPEVAFVMFGTNDLGQGPADKTGYENDLKKFVQACLDHGTVAVLYTIPPRQGLETRAAEYADAVRRVAAALKVPLADYHAEILRRRPNDWLGTIIDKDGVHPSFPQAYQHDFTDEGLKNSGYTLRNYLALKIYLDLLDHVLRKPGEKPGTISPVSNRETPPAAAATESKCPCTADTAVSSHPQEQSSNFGTHSQLRIKGNQMFVLLQFDTSKLPAGSQVYGATLFVHNAGKEAFRIDRISTIAQAWAEGQGHAEKDAACFTHAGPGEKGWGRGGGDFLSVTFGKGGSILNSKSLDVPADNWGSVELDADLGQALADRRHFGLALARDSWVNVQIWSREQWGGGVAAYLVLRSGSASAAPSPARKREDKPRGQEIRCAVTEDVWVSSYAEEANHNMGAAGQLKLKSIQEMAILRFDVSGLRGRRVRSARLFLHAVQPFMNPEGDIQAQIHKTNCLRYIGVSTVASDWVEGRSASYATDEAGHGASFLEASHKKKNWAGPGSDLTWVTMGNGHSRHGHSELFRAPDNWFYVDVPPELVEALVAGESYGLFVSDESGEILENNFVHSRESGAHAPYLVVEPGPGDATPPQPPANLKFSPAPDLASLEEGAASLTLTVPEDAFCFFIQVNGEPLPRHEIPLPVAAGKQQVIGLRGLAKKRPITLAVEVTKPDIGGNIEAQTVVAPAADLQVEVRVSDAAGNLSEPARVTGRSSPVLSAPTPLPEVRFSSGRQELPAASAKLRAWAYPEIEKVDPLTGENLDRGGLDYRLGNHVWDSKAQTVRLAAARGETVGFQLGIEALAGTLGGIRVEVTGLEGPDKILEGKQLQLYRVWYVQENGRWHAESAIPHKPGDTATIPDPANRIPGQKVQSYGVEIFIPQGAKPGEYRGSIRISAEGTAPVSVSLLLKVYSLALPEELSFWPELNCYGGPGQAGSDYFFDSHRLAQAHRSVINRVPYSQSGKVHDDLVPPLRGTGASAEVADWARFDAAVSTLLDGSAFKEGPGAGLPVKVMYLPLHENWPTPLEGSYAFRPRVTSWPGMLVEHALLAPPIEEAFPQSYKDAFKSLARQYAEHIKAMGWTRTEFQCYLNNKNNFKNPQQGGRGVSWWLLDEPYNRGDWVALNYFGRLFHEGIRGIDGVQLVYRGDISRPQWQRTWSDGIMNVMYVGGLFEQWRAVERIHRRTGMRIRAYGACNHPKDSHLNTEAWCVKSWLYGAEAVVPWSSLGGDAAFDQPDPNALVIDGRRFGLNAVASLRLKALRRGQQDVEYLAALGRAKGYTLEQVRVLAAACLKLDSKTQQRFLDDAAPAVFERLSSEDFARLRESIARELGK